MTIDEFNRIKADIESHDWIKNSSGNFNFGDSIGVSSYNQGVLPVIDLKNRTLRSIGGKPISFRESGIGLNAEEVKLNLLRFTSNQPSYEKFPEIYSGFIASPNGSSVAIQGNRVVNPPQEVYFDETLSGNGYYNLFPDINNASLSYDSYGINAFIKSDYSSSYDLAENILSIALDKFYSTHGCSIFDYMLYGGMLTGESYYSISQLCSNFLTNLDGSNSVGLEIDLSEQTTEGMSYRVNQISSLRTSGTDVFSFKWNLPSFDIEFSLISSTISYGEGAYDPCLELRLKFSFNKDGMSLINDDSNPIWAAIANAERNYYDDNETYSNSNETITDIFKTIRVSILIPLIISSDSEYNPDTGYYDTIIKSISIRPRPITTDRYNCKFGWAIDDMRYSKILSSYWTQSMSYGGYEYSQSSAGELFPNYYFGTHSTRVVRDTGTYDSYSSFSEAREHALGTYYNKKITCAEFVDLSSIMQNAKSVTLGDMNLIKNEFHLSSSAITNAYQFIDRNVSAIGDGTQDTKQKIKSILGI